MSIGGGIALIVIGAVLSFALDVQVAWLDIKLVGYILMAAGAVVLIFGIVMLARRRTSVSTTRSAVDPVNGTQVTQRTNESDPPIR